MPNQQRTARKCLTEWLRVYRQIKFHESRVMAVSQLVGFAKEMEIDLASPLMPVLPLGMAVALRNYNQPVGKRIVDGEVAAMLAASEAPDQEIVGDLEVPEKDIPVDFSGVIEARNMAQARIPPPPVPAPPPPPAPSAFPDETELTLIGACPNPRLLQGQLPDGRKVTVWKGPRFWRIPTRIPCRRDPNTPATAPIYLPV